MSTSGQHRQSILICVCLAVLIAAVYWPVGHAGFLNYDDDEYVTANPHVREGVTVPGVVWAFTTGYAGNWFPLTWLSLALDCQWFGMNADGLHAVNVLLHAASTVLLFLVLRRMTGTTWRSAWVAALFGVHPLHVESVAWVTERKDVLSGLFWMLAMWAYVRYVEQPGGWRQHGGWPHRQHPEQPAQHILPFRGPATELQRMHPEQRCTHALRHVVPVIRRNTKNSSTIIRPRATARSPREAVRVHPEPLAVQRERQPRQRKPVPCVAW